MDMHEEKFKALPDQLRRIWYETNHNEWVGDNTLICAVWSYDYPDMHMWQVWQGREMGWAEMIACDKSAHYRNPGDAIAAAKRTLILMGLHD